MVAKITYGSSIYGAVSYNQEKVDEGTAKVIHTHNMINNLSEVGISFSQTLRSFEDYIDANPKVKTPVAHFSLNPSLEDKLTDEEFSLLADDYMEKMGYKDQPYIVYKHEDIDRTHIHIVSVRVDETGKKIKDSHDFEKSMNACRELELKYNLKQVSNQANEESIHYLKKIDYTKGDIKRQISNILKSVIKDYRFQSFGEFNALLSCYNIHCKQVKGEEQGNPYRGVVYCATNDAGELMGLPVKSSRIGKSVGYDALNKRMNKTSEKIKAEGFRVPGAKSVISVAMRNSKNKEEFTKALKEKNIDVVFRQNEEGRIYGVTFLDHNHKIAFNGSRLGKEFSANVFNKLFNENKPLSQEKTTLKPVHEDTGFKDTVHQSPAMVDEIFGTFYLTTVGYDPEEEEFMRRMKRKRKTKRKKNL